MNLQTCTESPQLVVERIERFVQNRTGGMIRDLRVEVLDGVVLISGRTATYYNKQLATHAALAVLEEVTLNNEIEVY